MQSMRKKRLNKTHFIVNVTGELIKRKVEWAEYCVFWNE